MMANSIVSSLKYIQHGQRLLSINSSIKSLLKAKPICVTYRSISTSKKNKDTATLADTLQERIKADSVSNAEVKPKNWISWGFSNTDIVDDNTHLHLAFFCIVTLCICGFSFIMMYQPDNRMIDWVRREAFLELRYREANGLPLIDPNLVPADKVELPSDEDLGDIKIII